MTAKEGKITPRAVRLFFVLFLGIGSVMGGLSAVLYRSEIQAFVASAADREHFELSLLRQMVDEVFDGIVGDLMFLAHQNELIAMLENEDDLRDAIAQEYFVFAAGKGIYDQIRFLDEQGMERVRVNFNAGAPSIVPDDALQDKRQRYYFADVIALEPGEVFVSPFDLNIEAGAVELPFKPMIRVGTPVVDSSGRKRGIVLLNYLGKDLLERLLETAPSASGDIMLLNSDGFWLLAPDTEDTWGFMLPGRAERRFAKVYPQEWKQMRSQRAGQLRTENGLFTFATVRPLDTGYRSSTGAADADAPSDRQLEADAYEWILVSHVPETAIESYTRHIRLRVFLFGGSAFAVIAIGAWFLAMAIVRRREYQARLMAMAHYDSLTALPNRTLFFDRLRFVHRNAVRYKRPYGLLYVDLDGFKDVNDRMGHDAGDAVLKVVAARIESGIRESDTAARLGGDEMAVLLSEISSIRAVLAFGDKLIKRISAPIQLGPQTVSVAASVGVAVYPDHGDTSEQVLAAADRAMYTAKSRGKGTCVAFDGSEAAD